MKHGALKSRNISRILWIPAVTNERVHSLRGRNSTGLPFLELFQPDSPRDREGGRGEGGAVPLDWTFIAGTSGTELRLEERVRVRAVNRKTLNKLRFPSPTPYHCTRLDWLMKIVLVAARVSHIVQSTREILLPRKAAADGQPASQKSLLLGPFLVRSSGKGERASFTCFSALH